MDKDKYIGRLLDNRYEILEVIGTGGMAVVYKARCHRLNRLVAIKILKDDNLDDEDFRRRFHAESQAVAMLSHPNIVAVYDVSTSIMADYIVMELIEGITLKQYMEKKGILNWKETLHFAIQIAKALEHAHSKGIVHRDIKPHNIMVLKNGSVKVMDFGIARMISSGNTLTKEALGSVHYISPEQAKGGRVDDRSDIYSLGVVMYEMMAGRPPYDGESPVAVAIQHINGGAALPSVLNPNIPGGLEQIIMKAMAHNVSDRYPSATRMLADMDEFRKNPSMLFDYTGLPLDAVMRIQKPPLVLQNPQPPVTTAEKVAGQQNVQRTASKPAAPNKERRQEAQRRRKQQEEEKRSRIATIAIISCSLVAVVAIVIFISILLGGGFAPEEKLIEVPDLKGEVFAQLQEYPGFTIMKEELHDESVEAGRIISQKPEAGKMVPEGSPLVLNVSLGPVPQVVTMGNLVERSLDWAKAFLNSQNLMLDVVVEEEFHEEIAEGFVIRTDPQIGAELSEGQTITLWVSKGKEIKSSSMPNVVDEEKSMALSILDLQQLDLVYTFEEVHDSKIKAGNVVKTEPARGEKLQTGQTVKLYISLGAEMEVMPGVLGMDIGSAVSVLKSVGFKTPTIVPVDSEEPKDTVVSQSLQEGLEYELTADIVLEISKGPQKTEEITKDVVIDLRNSALEGECRVSVSRDGVEIYAETVPQGTSSVTLSGQKGNGVVRYNVVINEQDGWEVVEEFTANG